MFDVGNDFPTNQVTCYSGFGFAERQILFSDVKQIHSCSGVMEHAMVIVSPLRRSVILMMLYKKGQSSQYPQGLASIQWKLYMLTKSIVPRTDGVVAEPLVEGCWW